MRSLNSWIFALSISVFGVALAGRAAQASGVFCGNEGEISCFTKLSPTLAVFATKSSTEATGDAFDATSSKHHAQRRVLEVVASEAAEFLMDDGKSEPSPLLKAAFDLLREVSRTSEPMDDLDSATLLFHELQ